MSFSRPPNAYSIACLLLRDLNDVLWIGNMKESVINMVSAVIYLMTVPWCKVSFIKCVEVDLYLRNHKKTLDVKKLHMLKETKGDLVSCVVEFLLLSSSQEIQLY